MSTFTTEQFTAAVAAGVASALADLGISLPEPAKTAPVKPAQPKAEPRYRTAKQIESGHAQEAAIYARYRATTGKGFKSMTAKQQAACKAEVRAVWSALKGTRKTSLSV